MSEAKRDPETRMEALAHSGRNWAAVREALEFKRPPPLFDQPMEITIQMLRGLRMVDETIVVHGSLQPPQGRKP
jgi:hypothetical protein